MSCVRSFAIPQKTPEQSPPTLTHTYVCVSLRSTGGCPYEKRLHSFTPNDPNNVCSIQNGTNPDGSMYQYIDSSGLGPGSPNYSCGE